MSGLRVRPIELRDANAYILEHHRHHGRVQGHRWSLGVWDQFDNLRGVAVVGRPTSGLDPRRVLEVTRLCSDGTFNVCSMLYSAAARAGKAMGFDFIQTYLYESESGVSLRASGWEMVRRAHPSGRHRARGDGRTRDTTHVEIAKVLWRKRLSPTAPESIAHHRNAEPCPR